MEKDILCLNKIYIDVSYHRHW